MSKANKFVIKRLVDKRKQAIEDAEKRAWSQFRRDVSRFSKKLVGKKVRLQYCDNGGAHVHDVDVCVLVKEVIFPHQSALFVIKTSKGKKFFVDEYTKILVLS